MAENTHLAIENAFSEVEDVRQEHKIEHSIENILFIILCGILCGAEKFTEIEAFAHSQRDWLEKYLNFKNGIPSDDTLNRTLGLLATTSFSSCFLGWMKLIGATHHGQIAIDGKVLRGSGSKQSAGKDALDMVTAFAVEQGLTLTQHVVDEKSNEITAIPHLLNMLDLSGCIVTIDAIGCQKEIVEQIVDENADYIIALKGNQGHLYEDAHEMFSYLQQNEPNSLQYCKTVNSGHGRLESRHCWLFKPADHAAYFRTAQDWTGLETIAVIRSVRRIGDDETDKIRFFISSLSESPETHLSLIRSHWAIENKAHWILDIALREDDHQLKDKTAAANLSIISTACAKFTIKRQEVERKYSH